MENQSTPATCPNCNTPFPNSYSTFLPLVPRRFGDFLREFTNKAAGDYCHQCYELLQSKAVVKYESEKETLDRKIKILMSNILIVSLDSPIHWDYEVLGLVTGQTITDSTIFTEFSVSHSDIFGVPLGTSNKKIANGEEICQFQMRTKCLQMGGNAIVGTHVNYAGVGSNQEKLMVCMSGTAVNLKNVNILGEQKADNITAIKSSLTRLAEISTLYYNGVHFVSSSSN